MGLEISHCKATLTKPAPTAAQLITQAPVKTPILPLDMELYGNYVTKNNFEGFDVEFDFFKPYIQEIYLPVCPKSKEPFTVIERYFPIFPQPKGQKILICAKNKSGLSNAKKYFKHSHWKPWQNKYVFIFEPNIQIIDELAQHFMQRLFNETELGGIFIDKGEEPDWYYFRPYTLVKNMGFYYEEVGHQRNSMNDDFWQHFAQPTCAFTKKCDFEYALSCIDYYYPDDTKECVEHRKREFKVNFIDSYTYGQSWMNISG